MQDLNTSSDSELRVGSFLSGYGGLDLAVEHVFNAKTVWFSELNEPVARVFSHHWPGAPNLGDITTIDWSRVEPVDILIGEFPCQDVSTVGKRAGLAPGTRSGLWSHMAAAIDVLQPQWVVIENVRGLLSLPAIRPLAERDEHNRRNPGNATLDGATLHGLEADPWHLGDIAARPLRALGAVLGDLADLRLEARWIGLPASLVGAPHQHFRIFAIAWRTIPHPRATDSSRGGKPSVKCERDEGRSRCRIRLSTSLSTDRLAHRSGEPNRRRWVPDRRTIQHWERYADVIARWAHITGRPAPAPALLNDAESTDHRARQRSVTAPSRVRTVAARRVNVRYARATSSGAPGVVPRAASRRVRIRCLRCSKNVVKSARSSGRPSRSFSER